MKKILLSLIFIIGAFIIPQNIFGCTQSHMQCEGNEPGLRLICGAPYTPDTCYAGGCGFGVIIVECKPDEQ